MNPTAVLDPILADGIRNVNFFNGRLLSAEDLSREQQASRERHALLGQAIGEGIAYGLEVSKPDGVDKKAVVTISAGLAVNREGRTLRLPASTDLSLIRPSNGSGPSGPTTFHDCAPSETGVYVAGAGVYLLVIAPAEGREGRALVSGLGNQEAPCNSKYIVDGVRFRLIQLEVSEDELDDFNRLRNRVAYKCFGIGEDAVYRGNLFGPVLEDYGALSRLRPDRLTVCDVPVAVLHWTNLEGVRFIDHWSVRRNLTSAATGSHWHHLLGDRRYREGQAMFLQFEEQIADLLATTPNVSGIAASEFFDFLPAIGILPVGPNRFNPTAFFQKTVPESPLEAYRLREVLHDGLFLEPFAVASLSSMPIRILTPDNTTQYIVYVREDAPVPVVTAPEEPAPTPPTKPATGSFIIALRDDKGDSVDPRSVRRVWAEDIRSDTIYQAKLSRFPYKRMKSKNRLESEFDREKELIVYEITKVPPGAYLLKAEAKGYGVASQARRLADGETIEVVLTLTKRGRKPPDDKTDRPSVRDKYGNAYEKVELFEEWQEKKFPPKNWPRPGPDDYLTLNPRAEAKIRERLQNYLDHNPEAPVTSENFKVALRPDYDPNEISDDPYAYVVTDGAAIAVVLVPADRSLVDTVPVSRADVPELDPERTADFGAFNKLDVFAAAWSGLVADVAGVSAESAKSLITEVRPAVAAERANLTYYPGVTADTGAKLKARGFSDDITLANAKPEDIRSALGEGFSLEFAQRLIDRARHYVPAKAWSMDAINLGLRLEQLNAAKKFGVDSLGTLRQALAAPEIRAELQAELGLSETAATTLAGAVTEHLNVVRVELSAEAPLTGLNLVDKTTAAHLVRAGYTSTTKLADAVPEQVAGDAGVPIEVARAIVKEATETTLVRKVGLSQAEANRVVNTLGVNKLSDLKAIPIGDLTAADKGGLSAEKAGDVIKIPDLLRRFRL